MILRVILWELHLVGCGILILNECHSQRARGPADSIISILRGNISSQAECKPVHERTVCGHICVERELHYDTVI